MRVIGREDDDEALFSRPDLVVHPGALNELGLLGMAD